MDSTILGRTVVQVQVCNKRNMLRRMLSKVLGVIFSIEAFHPRTELKLLHRISILVWSVDSLKMPTHHHWL